MMKLKFSNCAGIKHRIVTLIGLLFIIACNSDSANDCFQTSGHIIQYDVLVSDFESILVNRDIALILKESPNYKVTIETGEHLINDVTVQVIDNRLILTNNNTCNFVRDYDITKVYVEAPNLTEIRSSTQFDISSQGILSYNSLTLVSDNISGESEFSVGDYRLTVNIQNLVISSNNLSFFYINGEVENLFIGFFSGSGRFEGAQLIAQDISIFHRGSNDMIVNPVQSLTGELRGTGNVISVNQPTDTNVTQFYTGQLVFENIILNDRR